MNHQRAFGLLAWLLIGASTGPAVTSTEVLEATGTSAGLAVILGCGDPALATGLHNSGRIMVQVLDSDRSRVQSVRSSAIEAGVYGVVAADRIADCSTIPLKDNVVTLLVADLDLLGSQSPTESEILRVIHPGEAGVAYVRQGGQWTKRTKPRPAEVDNWTHWDHGPDGNAYSGDRLVDVPTGFQWIGTRFGSNGHSSSVRVWNDLVTFQESRGKGRNWLTVRNSFNGMLMWHKRTNLMRPTILDSARLYCFPNHNEPEVAFDARTGEELLRYDRGGVPTSSVLGIINGNGYGIFHVLAKGMLLQGGGERDSLWALDKHTGELRWAHHDSGHIQFVVADEAGGRVFASVGGSYSHIGRWPSASDVVSIICLNLDDGQLLWKVPCPVKHVSGLVYSDNRLVTHTSNAIWGIQDGDRVIKVMDASDGHVLHSFTYRDVGFNFALREKDLVYFGGGITSWDLTTGEELSYWNYLNQGCMRGVVTPRQIVFGHLGFITDPAGTNLKYTSFQRPACATGVTPANGMWYAAGNNFCLCIRGYKAHMAWTCAAAAEPIADSERLESAQAMDQPRTTTPGPFSLGESILASDWVLGIYGDTSREASQYIKPAYFVVDETVPVHDGDLTFVAVCHQHRLEARRGDQVVWSYVAGGRIPLAPIVHEGKIYFGCRDGWVYCLNAADGKPVWRFLAAARDQRIAISSQVESVWPATNVLLHDGAIAVAAGLTSEADGGSYVWGLDPATGAIKWKFRLLTPPLNKPQSVPNNKQPGVVTQQLVSTDGVLHMGTTWGGYQSVVKPLDPVGWNNETIDLISSAPVWAAHFEKWSYTHGDGLTLSPRSFSLPWRAQATVRLFDAKGRVVRVLFKGVAGTQSQPIKLDKARLASAWYLLRLESRGRVVDMPISNRR